MCVHSSCSRCCRIVMMNNCSSTFYSLCDVSLASKSDLQYATAVTVQLVISLSI